MINRLATMALGSRFPTLVTALLALALVALPGRALPQQSLTLANGDQLTGQLKAVDAGNWIFTYQGQAITIPADQVQAFAAPERIGIRLGDTTIVVATVEPAADGLLLGLEDGSTLLVQPADFGAVGSADDLKALEPIVIGLYSPFLKFWKFLGSAGGTIQRGNTDETNFSFSLDLSRETKKDRTEFTTLFTTTKEYDNEGNVTSTEPKLIVSLGTDIFLVPGRFFTGVTMRWQHDPDKDIQFRQTYSAGLGYQFVQNDNTSLFISLGAGGRFDNLTTGVQNTSTPILDTAAGFRQRAGPVLFKASFSYNPSLEQFSEFELIDSYEIAITAIEGLTFKTTLLHEYNNPPPSGDEKNDLTITFQLGWALGAK
ncbi:MAG: DUF481 domain-containing protein [Gemmatimonadota bacterium]|nr:MAG: DUF481 domain-containing protein [Gemmatimonadota bacterium]